jgi:hypothetical protein
LAGRMPEIANAVIHTIAKMNFPKF